MKDWQKALLILGWALVAMLGIGFFALIGLDNKAPAKVHWVGYLIIGRDDVILLVGDVQVGLREDGVVVWQRISTPESKEPGT